jgi:asparagine synthase (glutamine-hydrolysing)
VAAHYDQPFGNSSVLPAYYCAKMAREDGVTRCWPATAATSCSAATRATPSSACSAGTTGARAAARGLLEPLFEPPPLGTLPLLRKGRSYVEQAKVPMPDRLQMYNLLLRLGPDEVLTPDFLAQVDTGLPAAQQREVWRRCPAPASSTACWPSTGATRWPRATCPRCAAPPHWPA